VHLARNDVAQADIAPLMAALLGLNYPANNVGVLPLDYLSGSEEFRARSALTNARQVLEQFFVKEGRLSGEGEEECNKSQQIDINDSRK
jgi:phosphatidylinositol glycan class N